RRGPSTHEKARVHHVSRRRGSGMAARGARAAAGDAGAAGLAGPRLPALGRVRQGLNEIYPTIVLLKSLKAVSSRSGRWRTGDESVCVASRWDAAPDDDTI